jgi:Ca2+-binding RTX toxin-like protein
LDGDDGNDVIDPGAGKNIVRAGAGNDTIGVPHSELSLDDPGSTIVLAGEGNDFAWGGALDDNIRGEAGNDELHGDWGNDRLDGGKGDDLLHGDIGFDRLLGGDGDDMLSAGDGGGILTGGAGADQFGFSFDTPDAWFDDPEHLLQVTNALITDFSSGDELDVSSLFYDGFAPHGFHQVQFADLDGNGDGTINGADPNIAIKAVSFMGESRPSLVIEDVGDISGMVSGYGPITLFDVTALEPADIAS